MTIGTKIKLLRDSKKLSQRDLAVKLGIEQSTLGAIETGATRKIDFLMMDKICKEFDVDFNHFLEEKRAVNKVKKAEYSNIGCENGTINLLPEGILENIIARLVKIEKVVYKEEV